jgi:hypothetical protein
MRHIALGVLVVVVALAVGCGSEEAAREIESTTAPEPVGYPKPSQAEARPTAGYPALVVTETAETAAHPESVADETVETDAYPASPEKPAELQEGVSDRDLDLAEANVVFVKAVQVADGTWRFDVTVRHDDAGWDHYADGWDVVTPDGTVLKADPGDAFTRVLLHPHDNEQPFTRSQSGLTIAAGVAEVTVRAHCNVHNFGGRDVVVDLTTDRGPDFEVQRQP